MKVKGQRNRENPQQKWKFFMDLHEEDAASAWTRRMDKFLPKGYVEKRQYPDEFMEMMTRESGIVMAGGDDRRFNECMEDELPGEIQPQRNEVITYLLQQKKKEE